MGFIRCGGKDSAIRRRSRAQTIAVCSAVLLLCLVGLNGCESSSSSPETSATSGNASPSSSCSSSSFVRGDHKWPMTKLPVLVSAQIAGVDIPPPDVNLSEDGDPDESLQEAHDIAVDGNMALSSPDNDPFQSLVSDDQADIDQEATGVGLEEEVHLLTDEGKSGLDASDFGQEVCNAVGSAKDAFSTLDNVNQIYTLLNQQGTTGSHDVNNVLLNGVQLFAQALGPCFDTLGVAEQILEDIEDLYC
jgi:hypothetical protein